MGPLQLAETIAVGAASGVLSGMFGLGGGLITTPAIRLVLGYPALIAVGTPLAVIVPATFTGLWQYVRRGDVDVPLGLKLGAVGMLSVVVGSLLTKYVGGSIILILTALLLLDNAFRLATGTPHESARQRSGLVVAVVIGLVTGLYAGFFGLGGGAILVPALVRWMGRPVREAIGTSLVAITLIAIPGILVHSILGHIDWILAGVLILGVVPGAAIGSRLAYLASERWLRIGFAVFLVVTAVILAVGEIGALR